MQKDNVINENKRTQGIFFIDNGDRLEELLLRVDTGDEIFDICDFTSDETENIKANAAFICKAVNNFDSLEAENSKLKRLLEDLTPGGSEFVNDPEYCFDFVKKELRSIPSQILPFKQRADKLKVINDSLLSALKQINKRVLEPLMAFPKGWDKKGLEMEWENIKEAIKKAEEL